MSRSAPLAAVDDPLDAFTAVNMVGQIERGALNPVKLVNACIERIEASEASWTQFDAQDAVRQAEAMEDIRLRGRPTGKLHGVPVAVADSLSPCTVGRVAVCDQIMAAGGIVVGHATGDSLAGAIAQMHVPLAVASLACGEAMRDASHHGVYAFKPSKGVISRRGVALGAPTVEHVGLLGRTLPDVALLADVLSGYDAHDDASFVRPRPRMQLGAEEDAPVAPNFVCLDLGLQDDCVEATALGIEELVEMLGGQAESIEASGTFAPLIKAQGVVADHELRGDVERDEYAGAMQTIDSAQTFLAQFFHDYDAIIAPSAHGERPQGGSRIPALSRVASACGLPSVSLPLLEGAGGLPVNVQLIGSQEEDRRLLRSARWLLQQISSA